MYKHPGFGCPYFRMLQYMGKYFLIPHLVDYSTLKNKLMAHKILYVGKYFH
jgi:hypothetical protein